MSYTSTTWVNGDVITAEKLNKLEGGVANAQWNSFLVTFTNDNGSWSADKTLEECATAYNAGKTMVAQVSGDELIPTTSVFSLSKAYSDDLDNYFHFSCLDVVSGTAYVYGIHYYFSESVFGDYVEVYKHELSIISNGNLG